ncbi:polymer-forming cytoskeletal protein [Granulicella sp. S190]|uniref:bactofilin family protein n=1 Tax=Granulicella sp. S190 TaxID=1747226 RepID=UPI00352A6EE6
MKIISSPNPSAFRKVIEMVEINVHRTLIGKSLILKGEITGLEAMHIEGRVEGSIALPGHTITVGRNGQTEAQLIASEIVVLGQVRGNCQASDHLDIRSEGSMSGDAIVSRISIADGAFVKGNIDVRRS